jgi:hypothetical protein
MSYPLDFQTWPDDRRNAWFADEARRVREAKSGGAAPAYSLSKPGARADGRPSSPGSIPRKRPTLTSGAKLLDMQFEPVRYVVPNYIAEGATILAGRPKLGKSWLALEMAIAVATGGTCLGGVECEQGDVLYLALEDNLRRLQSRMDRLMPAGTRGPANLDFATEWARANDGGLEDIRQWLVEHNNARLVIVDVLAQFRPARGGKEQLYDSDYGAVKALQALAMEFGVAIVIIHHTRKGGSDGDAFEKVSGTLGLSGAADTTLILDRDGNGCTIYGRGRDIPEIETAVSFDRDTCKWAILGQAAEVRKTDERKAILRALEEAEGPMSVKDIMLATESTNRNAVDLLLFKMAKAGDIDRAGRGLYIFPGKIAERNSERNDAPKSGAVGEPAPNLSANLSTPGKIGKKGKKLDEDKELQSVSEASNLSANLSEPDRERNSERSGEPAAAADLGNLSDLSHLSAPGKIDGKKDRGDGLGWEVEL